jgi:hypothetical protein
VDGKPPFGCLLAEESADLSVGADHEGLHEASA